MAVGRGILAAAASVLRGGAVLLPVFDPVAPFTTPPPGVTTRRGGFGVPMRPCLGARGVGIATTLVRRCTRTRAQRARQTCEQALGVGGGSCWYAA